MKSQVTPEAELDLIEAIRWYDERDRELGDDLLRQMYHCIASIETNPRSYPIVHRQMRRALVRRFPFQILYEIESEEGHHLLHLPFCSRPGSLEATKNRLTRTCFVAQEIELGRSKQRRT